MRRQPLILLAAVGLLGGCTTFVPVPRDGGTTWAEARQAPYRSDISRLEASQAQPWHGESQQVASAGPVVYSGPLEPAPARDSFDPRPLPPLQGQASDNGGWQQDEGWRTDTRGYSVPAEVEEVRPLRAEPEPVVAAAPERAAPPAPPPQAARPSGVGEAASGSANLDPPALSNVGFLWPADGEVRDGRSAGAPSHVANGLTIQARPGEPFVASENGIVVFAGNSMETYGNMVVIRHDGDYTTAYGHAERLDVAVGDVVRRGQRLGVVGATGAVNDPQLYFEMRVGSQVVDPRHYLMGSPQLASN